MWTYAAAAVDGVREGLGRRALRRLRETGGPIESAIDELIDGMAVFGEELLLVFDDMQAVTDPECLASIEYAIRSAPANVRLIAVTRTDPALRLAHLRAGGELTELRASELAFTAAEARAFFVERSGSTSSPTSSSCCTSARRAGPPPCPSPPTGFAAWTIRTWPRANSAGTTGSWRNTSATR